MATKNLKESDVTKLIQTLIKAVEKLEKEVQELKAQPKQEFHYHTHYNNEGYKPIYPQLPWTTQPWPDTGTPSPWKPTVICKTETNTVPAIPDPKQYVVYNGTISAAPSAPLTTGYVRPMGRTAGGVHVN